MKTAFAALTAVVLCSGCSFSTLEDDRKFHDELLGHIHDDGNVTRTLVTESFVTTDPEVGEALIAIGERKTGDAAALLAARRETGKTLGVGSVGKTIEMLFGPEGLLAAFLALMGYNQFFGKSRLVKDVEKAEAQQKKQAIVTGMIKAANGGLAPVINVAAPAPPTPPPGGTA